MLQWSGDGSKLNKWKVLSSEVQGPGLARGWSKHIILKNTSWKLKLHSFWFCSVLFLGIECYFFFFCHFYNVRGCPSSQTGAISPPPQWSRSWVPSPQCQQQRCFRPCGLCWSSAASQSVDKCWERGSLSKPSMEVWRLWGQRVFSNGNESQTH